MKQIFLLALLVQVHVGLAQEPDVKEGKVKPEDFLVPEFIRTEQPNSSGVVLFEEVKLNFLDSRLVQIHHYERILILSEQGATHGEYQFRLSRQFGKNEDITGISGATFHLVDGEVERVKLKNEHITRKDIGEWQALVSVSLPDVQPGSIIELSWNLNTEFIFDLPAWEFQREIPVMFSKATFTVPEGVYSPFLIGDHPLLSEEQQKMATSSTESRIERNGRTVTTASVNTLTSYGNSIIHRWSVEKVPGLKEEPLSRSLHDYLGKIEMGVISHRVGNIDPGDHTTPDEWLNFALSNDDLVGEWLSFGVPGHADFVELSRQFSTRQEQAEAIFSKIQTSISWDGVRGIGATRLPLTVWNQGSGSLAEINLMLIGALRAIELEAYPVVLGSRTFRRAQPNFASFNDFNYLIAAVKVEDKWILLDASHPYLSFGELPLDACNETAFLTGPSPNWFTIPARQASSKTSVQLSIEGNTLLAEATLVESAFAGQERRRVLSTEKTSDRPFQVPDSWELQDINWEIREDGEVSSHTSFQQKLIPTADTFAINPYLLGLFLDLPLTKESRTLPVDLGYTINRTWQSTMLLPQGYMITSIPEQAQLVIPDQKALFRYRVNQVGNMISISGQLQIKSPEFAVSEYGDLRQFFSMVEELVNQEFVITRI